MPTASGSSAISLELISDEPSSHRARGDGAAMNVTLEKSFPLPGSAETAWQVICDIEAVAGCMPGARITERIDEQHFKGSVSVKFGPASLSFRGEIAVKSIDATSRTLVLSGRGTDATGSSGASMDLSARIEAIDAHNCTLIGNGMISVSGKAATFGGRMMGSVADQVLKQFADHFGARVEQTQGSQVAVTDQPGSEGARPIAVRTTLPTAVHRALPTATAVVQQPAELNALSLLWGMIRDGFKSLLGAYRR
jgi:carbon monoxide dehydrogenase subunit G